MPKKSEINGKKEFVIIQGGSTKRKRKNYNPFSSISIFLHKKKHNDQRNNPFCNKKGLPKCQEKAEKNIMTYFTTIKYSPFCYRGRNNGVGEPFPSHTQTVRNLSGYVTQFILSAQHKRKCHVIYNVSDFSINLEIFRALIGTPFHPRSLNRIADM